MARDPSQPETATPKKRRDERKKGHVFLSKDAVAVATLIGSVMTLRLLFLGSAEEMARFLRYCLSLAGDKTSTGISGEILSLSLTTVAKTAGPMLLVAALTAIIATFAQTKLLVAPELLKPKLNKISPIEGFKRLFSFRSVIEALKGILKIAILLVLIYTCLRDLIQVSPRYLYADVYGACTHLFGAIFSMLLKVVVAFIVLAAFDFLYQWWDFEQQMKMTKQEVKEEYKQTEGDPQIKGKIRQLQRQMAQSRMMQQVPQADVVVRNPTHFAVALRYHPGEDTAPLVLAKGQDELALRIVAVAEENHVTVIENVPLARALYAGAELDRQIPPELYEPVAEVMVYLYRLGKLKGTMPEAKPEE